MMRKLLLIFLTTLLLGLSYGTTLAADNCLSCHLDWEDEEGSPSALHSRDVHTEAGLSCFDCHGGDPELEDMDEVRASKDWRGVPDIAKIPQFCARCHSDPTYMVKHNPALPTDQFDKYKTSVHGKLLLEKGDTKVANCASCHSAHDIQSPEIPTSTVYPLNIPGTCAKCHANPEYMKGYDIGVTQYDDYRASVHGMALLDRHDLAAPACNDCHGNHGATPPGVESISAVCGSCHALIADRFSHSPHKTAFDERNYPECESCHSNHRIDKPNIDWVGTTEPALCIRCHEANDGTTGLESAQAIHDALAGLTEAYELGRSHIREADSMGMMVVDEMFLLKEVEQALVKAKTEVHTFNAGAVTEITNEGLDKAEAVAEAGLAKIDDYFFRRKGLLVATLFITLLSIALYMKIRRLDK